jgi:hypothetical protein
MYASLAPVALAALVTLPPLSGSEAPSLDRLRIGAGLSEVHVSVQGQLLGTREALVFHVSYVVWRGGPVGILASLSLSGQRCNEDGSLLLLASQHMDVELYPASFLRLRAGLGWSEQIGHDAFGLDAGLASRPTLVGGVGFLFSQSPRIGLDLQISRDVFQELSFVRGGALVTVPF